ncbi:YajG family lipoprotein [Metapseudomonas furukawaii]
MKKLQHLIFAVLVLSLGGCVSFTPSGPIGPPAQTAEKTYAHAAMIDDVRISDVGIDKDAQRTISNQLTSQIGQHIERGEYFQRLIAFPAKVDEEDVVLKFNFTTLQGKRTPHPGYFPGALLTLTMWIWVNGPIYVDKYNLAGELVIEDARGQRLASSRKTLVRNQNTGFWDRDYYNMSLGDAQLTQLVEDLLKDTSTQLLSR